MISKEQCTTDVVVIVNDKKTKWNEDLGATQNGLFSFEAENHGGITYDTKTVEHKPGTVITILTKPKMFSGSRQVRFKVSGDESIYSSFWCSFKHKVDLMRD